MGVGFGVGVGAVALRCAALRCWEGFTCQHVKVVMQVLLNENFVDAVCDVSMMTLQFEC